MSENQEYVTVQLQNAQLGRLEALMEANLARQEVMAYKLKSEIIELRGEIKALNAKIDSAVQILSMTNSHK